MLCFSSSALGLGFSVEVGQLSITQALIDLYWDHCRGAKCFMVRYWVLSGACVFADGCHPTAKKNNHDVSTKGRSSFLGPFPLKLGVAGTRFLISL